MRVIDTSGRIKTIQGTVAPVGRAYNPPDNSAFTWLNQGSSTITQQYGWLHLSVPGNHGGSAGRYITMPTPPYTLTIALHYNLNRHNYNGCGVFIRDSATSRLCVMQFQGNSTHMFGIYNLTNPTTYNSTVSEAVTPMYGSPVWLQLYDDATNINLRFGTDGINFGNHISFDRDAFVASPNQIGFHVGNETNQGNVGMSLLSWEVA